MSRRRELTWRSARRSSGATIKKLSGSLAQERERLDEERTAFLLEKAEAEEEQRLAAKK